MQTTQAGAREFRAVCERFSAVASNRSEGILCVFQASDAKRAVKRAADRRKERAEACANDGQANKSARGMPWHQEPKKDVISCEKPRGAANKLRSGDVRMGKPT